jgi:hypothetical protein
MNFRSLAFAADNATLHFLCHRFAQFVQPRLTEMGLKCL